MNIRTALRPLGVVFFTALAAAPVGAQTIEFQGSAVVHDFSAACQNAGWYAPAQTFFMRYYPAGLGDNPNSASFSFTQSQGAMGFRQPDGGMDNSFRAVEGTAIFGSSWTFTNARARFNRQVPSQITAATTAPIRVTGQIRNFGGARQCDVRFEAVLIRIP